jgi:hypothetical protein
MTVHWIAFIAEKLNFLGKIKAEIYESLFKGLLSSYDLTGYEM